MPPEGKEPWIMFTPLSSGDRSQYSEARADLKKGIKEAKASCKRKIEEHFTGNNLRKMWQGTQHVINRKSSSQVSGKVDTSLAVELNCFFAHSEAERPKIGNQSSVQTHTDPPPSSSSSKLTL